MTITSVAHPSSQCHIEAWARIDNHADITADLPASLALFVSQHDGVARDASLVLAAYIHWGEDCIAKLVGDFSFAIKDDAKQRLLLARDHLGVKPLYYTPNLGDAVLPAFFACSLPALEQRIADAGLLSQSPFHNKDYQQDWLINFLLQRSADWVNTAFVGVNKVPPAHYIVVDHAGNCVSKQYFTFSPDADLALESSADYVQAYRAVLHEAIACRVPVTGLVGSELSGGLDSSTITALASRSMQTPGRHLHSFGMAVSQYSAEAMAAVMQTSRGAMTHFITPTQGHYLSDQEFWEINGVPEEHINSRSHFPFYQLCKGLDIPVLLSGFGGDEFVTNAAPCTLIELWKTREWAAFYERQRGNLFSKPLYTLRWLYLYYRHRNQSVTSRKLQAVGRASWSLMPLQDRLLSDKRLYERYIKPLRYDANMQTQNAFSLQNRWSPDLTARLENCTLAAAHFGVDYRWPLLDIRLLTLFFSIPAREKMGPGFVGRYLHRCAAAPVLPNHIAWGPKELVEPHWLKRLFIGKRLMEKMLHAQNALPLSKVPKHYQTIEKSLTEKQQAALKTPKNEVSKEDITTSAPQFPQPHSALEGIIDKAKLAYLYQKRREADQETARLCSGIINQYETLNRWLEYRDKKTG